MATKGKNIIVIMCSVILTTIAVGGILYACGAVTSDITRNTEDISKLDDKTEANEKSIHRVELDAKDIKALAATAAAASISSNQKFEAIQIQLAEHGKIQAINSTKLETLTKD